MDCLGAAASSAQSRAKPAGYIDVSPTSFDAVVADGQMPGTKRVYPRTVADRLKMDAAFDALHTTTTRVSATLLPHRVAGT
jgi:hypothetical protein